MLTCLKCHVVFTDGELQREHYHCDWHRYNITRSTTNLPPVTVEEFKERVLLIKTKVEKEGEAKSTYCKACRKSFHNLNSYKNHLGSKKHIENERKFKELPPRSSSNQSVNEDDDLEIEEVDSDEWEGDAIPITDCFFCNKHSSSMELNVHHMTSIHSFFIPDQEYCTDVIALLTYLGEKVGSGFECIWCAERSRRFHDVDGVQKHMKKKRHTNMRMQGGGLMEYSQFYDYSSSYPDAGQGVSPDQEVTFTSNEDQYELVLPSGAVIGHRSLLRYYKQTLHPERVLIAQRAKDARKKLDKCTTVCLGGRMLPADVASRARDVKFMHYVKAKHEMRLAVKANKFQPHLRPQVVF